MNYRDRIKELRRVPARQLKPNPKNWRMHPPAQHEALRGILSDVGFADAVLVRELGDGTLEIIDGHLRTELTPDALVPVLVLDVSAAEADKILATHDAITNLADTDFTQLQSLLDTCSFADPHIAAMFAQLEEECQRLTPNVIPFPKPPGKAIAVEDSYQIVVTCPNESSQRVLYERLSDQGFVCRLLML